MIGISIAGFDPSGGAGIIADMKTFSALNVYGTGVITALTAQNPNKVFSLQPVAIDYIEEQIDSIFEEYNKNINYGKTGMLYSPEIVKLVSKKINEYKFSVVVDPVMVASAGGALASGEVSQNELANSMKKHLLPNCIIATPNIQEAEILSNMKITNTKDAIIAAKKIGKVCNVIITGGHLNGVNTLFDGEIAIIEKNLIKTNNIHGSGCSFSASLASFMIKGNDLKNSVEKSLDFVEIAIENGWYGTLKQNHDSNES